MIYKNYGRLWSFYWMVGNEDGYGEPIIYGITYTKDKATFDIVGEDSGTIHYTETKMKAPTDTNGGDKE